MKKQLYLLIISFSLINCYTYRPATAKDDSAKDKVDSPPMSEELTAKMAANPQATASEMRPKSPSKSKAKPEKPASPRPATIEEKLEINKFYKIDVADRSYKIQVDKWVSDTLVAHVIHKPKKILKFHKNQIDPSTIAERRFSKPTADIITVVAYAAVGVGIWALVN
ncbi:MAG: hypothetical protein L6262_05100 [Weeksellaceae bacterium]|nr:hypothetical protein [Weeksellaceae bacterium]